MADLSGFRTSAFLWFSVFPLLIQQLLVFFVSKNDKQIFFSWWLGSNYFETTIILRYIALLVHWVGCASWLSLTFSFNSYFSRITISWLYTTGHFISPSDLISIILKNYPYFLLQMSFLVSTKHLFWLLFSLTEDE